MLNVLYFASLREAVGASSEQIALPLPATVDLLIALLRARGGKLAVALGEGKRWRVAVNQQMAEMTTTLSEGDEVAIFPPVTGG